MRTLPALLALLLAPVALAGPTVRVHFTDAARGAPASGRLIVLMKAPDSKLSKDTDPLDGPFWEAEQPLFAADVHDLKPGAVFELKAGPGVDSFPVDLDHLAPGAYEVQARLDIVREDSSWRRQTGNLYSKSRATLTIAKAGADATVDVTLDAATVEPARAPAPGLEWFSVRSELLSKFRGRDVFLRAGVALPAAYDPKQQYAAVYEVPGFGGDDRDAAGKARRRGRASDLDRSTFWIVLKPEGPNGHTLFADSANNGPCGRALVEELIPALEKKYPLVAKPAARLLRGHSSGGWSTLWLATEYPGTFGACWSSSPDPVDFRRFQLVDIYAQHFFYGIPLNGLRTVEAAKAEDQIRAIPQSLMPAVGLDMQRFVSYRRDGRGIMTVEREARGEDMIGPDNTSAQQWDSWFAVWGPRNAAGHPQALFDPATGLIDREVAAKYRPYDIADRLRKDPKRFVPIFKNNIRLVVGDADNFFLNEAVALLKHDLEALPEFAAAPAGPGFITIVGGGLDHGSIFASKELRAFEPQMVEHLKANGLAH